MLKRQFAEREFDLRETQDDSSTMPQRGKTDEEQVTGLLPIPEFSLAPPTEAQLTVKGKPSKATDVITKHFRSYSSDRAASSSSKQKINSVSSSSKQEEAKDNSNASSARTKPAGAGHRRVRTDPNPARPVPTKERCAKFPFSEKHLQRHQSNIQEGSYAITTFEDYLRLTANLHKKRTSASATSSSASGPSSSAESPEKKTVIPKLLLARESKETGESDPAIITRSHSCPEKFPVLKQLEISNPNDVTDNPIETCPVSPSPPSTKRKSHKWNSWFG